MPHSILRRRTVPRLHAVAPRKPELPGFLTAKHPLPMQPAAVTGPHDVLEQAILLGEVWEMNADPIKIDDFDADQDVISVIVEKRIGALEMNVKQDGNGFEILANGKKMACVATQSGACFASNVRVLEAVKKT